MASFLARAFHLEEAPRPARFADTDRSSHEASIDALAAAKITAGCATDPLRFCPELPVTRGQMPLSWPGRSGWFPSPSPSRPPAISVSRPAIGMLCTAHGRVDRLLGVQYLRTDGRAPRQLHVRGRRDVAHMRAP